MTPGTNFFTSIVSCTEIDQYVHTRCVLVYGDASVKGHLHNTATSFNRTPCSAPFDIPCIDMCTFEPSKIRTPPYTGQVTVVLWCPYYGGFTVQDCSLWSQWCPYYRGFTVQDCLLWSQWCPYYRGFTVQDCLLWTQWCPYYRGFTLYSDKWLIRIPQLTQGLQRLI